MVNQYRAVLCALLPFMLFSVPSQASNFGMENIFGDRLEDVAADSENTPRFRFFSGLEYEDVGLSNALDEVEMTTVHFDGWGTINKNWQLGLVSERLQFYRDGNRLNDADIIEFKPRYENAITSNLRYNVMVGYRHVEGNRERNMFKLRPAFFYRNGDHAFNVNGLYIYRHGEMNARGERIDKFESEPNYNYRINDSFSTGAGGLYESEFNQHGDNTFRKWGIKPFITYRVNPGFTVTLRQDIFQVTRRNNSGWNQFNTNIQTTTRLTDSIRLVANVAYRHFNEFDGRETSEGNKDVLFGRVGLSWSF